MQLQIGAPYKIYTRAPETVATALISIVLFVIKCKKFYKLILLLKTILYAKSYIKSAQ